MIDLNGELSTNCGLNTPRKQNYFSGPGLVKRENWPSGFYELSLTSVMHQGSARTLLGPITIIPMNLRWRTQPTEISDQWPPAFDRVRRSCHSLGAIGQILNLLLKRVSI